MASEQTGLYPRLSSQIQEKFLALQQTQKIYDQKDSWRVEMELIIQELYPTCRLVLCGSSANGFGSIDSDIDMDLVLGTKSRFVRTGDILRRIESLFIRKPRRFETEVIPNANVPIITLKDKEKSFESDITVENWNSARNAFLLKCYSECDPRVKPLVIVIKLWAQKVAIVGAKLKRLPGFAVVLMAIHFLQAGCSPPVVPVLQKDFPELFRSSNTEVLDQLIGEIPIRVKEYKSVNKQSLGELLIAFFRYYSDFQWADIISIRTGTTLDNMRYSRVWRGPKIRIEDPTDTAGNVTRAVFDEYEARRIKNAFKLASRNLNGNASLESIL